ncbi:M15 family metallopeptidase [Lacipirellula sp.]|uniref:M15 family metallopeptidase n=1 Tax=Lacipirellula sp. TaxID=2691419 RepID=UPI003D0A69E4
MVDCNFTRDEAFQGVRADCPEEIIARQELLKVEYYSFDGKLHRGQVVIDRDLTRDVSIVFGIARDHRFPIHSAIPMAHPSFLRNGQWDDCLSMEANNSSAFNYREIDGTDVLSYHAWGRAIDINPLLNPYVRGREVSPRGGTYDEKVPGTLLASHPIVKAFTELGWTWGGAWQHAKDYQHFEKSI